MAYFANGTEGGIIDAQCAECRIPGGSPCPVYHVQLEHNYEQTDNPLLKSAMNKLINEDGLCLMKPILDALRFDDAGKQLFRPPMVGDSAEGEG